MKIDALSIKNPLILAPLAGYTDLPFRLLCREHGAGLCYSEMISCHGLVYKQKNTIAMIRTAAAERPVAMQLFGADPGIMGDAAAILSEHPIDMIDINMGCPVKKVTKKGAGAALMRDPQLARRIIRAVCRNTKLPVAIKIRSGWTPGTINAVDFSKMAEDEGVKAIAVHGRTWKDGFSGHSDWQIIANVKKAVSIPVIGNGDVKSYQDAQAMMAETGCDGVMIGRAALGAPWIFRDKGCSSPPLSIRLGALKRHLELISQFQSPDAILPKIKNQAGRYFKGVSGKATLRKTIYEFMEFENLLEYVHTLHDQQSKTRLTQEIRSCG